MAMKDNFLREVKIGDRVELMIGPKEMTGTVVALDLETVRIRRENGKEPVLALDSISYYEVGDDDESADTQAEKELENISPKKAITVGELGENEEEIRHSVSTAHYEEKKPVNAERVVKSSSIGNALDQLGERGKSFFEVIETPIVREVKDVAKMTNDATLKNEIDAIANSLDYAINQAHEISPADYKIQENIGRIKRLIRNYPRSKTPNNLLGAVYYRCKCDGLALEAYENGDDNESAFVIAENYHNEEKKLSFAVRHFVLDKGANAYIYRYLLEKMVEMDDYSVISKVSTKAITSDKLQAYHTFMRAVLLSNNVEYNAMLDFDMTEASLEDLLRIFKGKSIGTKNEFINLISTEETSIELKTTLQDARSLEECPIFAAAEQARMEEKNLVKAEKLYIRAIEANEKPGSAVANLYQILIQKREFKDCAMYLGRYGSKYMREEAYANLKKQFLSVAPASARSDLAKYEKEDKDPVDYFILAQKAELDEKDLQKAINYYKKAIEQKQRLSSSVPNLAAIYSRLEMFDEALSLLNSTGQSAMGKNAYLNLKQSILVKAKNKKYLQDIQKTFDQMIDMAVSLEKQTEISASKANLLSQIEEYDEAIKIYEYCLKNCDKKNYSREKRNKQKMYVLTGICNSLIHKNDLIKAEEYARQLASIDPNNEFAKSILSGNIDEDIELIEENIGVTHINEFIKKKIEEMSLDSEVKMKNLLEEGEFVGTQDKAASILDSIMDPKNRSVNEEAKSNQYLAGAKLIRQILNRDEDIDIDRFNEQRFLYFIAEGSCSYANSRLYRTELADNLDVARYFYIQPITIFNDSEKLRSSWAVATVRYIQTYFDFVENIRKEGNALYQKFKDHNACVVAIQKIMQSSIRTEVDVFTIGMMELLTYNTRIKKQVLSSINVNVFQGRILDVLARILDTDVPDISTVDDLENVWDRATSAYYAKRKAFLRLIEETIESLFAVGQLQENLEKVKCNSFNSFLNNTDKEYIRNLYEIFASIARYNEIAEFDYKADTLKRADDARKMLEEKICEYPTYLSYEKILPQLEQIQVKILKESVLLYGNSEPQISVALSGDCSVEEDKMIVRVPIAYTNKFNAQNADNVQMSIYGDGVENLEDTMLSRDLWMGDGRAREKMITFKISDKVLEDKVFSLEILVNYQYRKNMTEMEDASANFVLTVPLYSESVFKPIDNRFKIISGGDPVHDKSMFYGRGKDISAIIDQIKNASPDNKSGKCLALYGQTRTGKTSILHHLQVKLREQGEENIIIDMESLGKLGLDGNNITEFLYKMLRTLNKELSKYHREIMEALKKRGIEIDAKSLLNNPDQSQLRFNEIFDDVYEVIKEQEKQYRIILMIDEFTYIYDWIRQGTMTDRIMKFWKAFMQTHNVFAVIIGQDHMMQFMSDQRFTNDFGIMELLKVSYLSKDDAQQLMDEPILYETESGEKISRYKKGALDRLYELTSGSAFLIGKICAGLVEYLNDTHSTFITRAHIDDYIKKMLPTFDEINFDPQYRDLSEIGENSTIIDKNKMILRRIAEFSNRKEYTPVEAVVRSNEDKMILDKLEQRDVVIISNGDRCKIKVALYKEWLIEKNGLGVM